MNDGTTGGSVAALISQGYEPGDIAVTGGQDATVEALRYIAMGWQDNSVLKDLAVEADYAARSWRRILEGNGVPEDLVNGVVNNQYMDVPAVFLPVIQHHARQSWRRGRGRRLDLGRDLPGHRGHRGLPGKPLSCPSIPGEPPSAPLTNRSPGGDTDGLARRAPVAHADFHEETSKSRSARCMHCAAPRSMSIPVRSWPSLATTAPGNRHSSR
jgi:hypothetical protein